MATARSATRTVLENPGGASGVILWRNVALRNDRLPQVVGMLTDSARPCCPSSVSQAIGLVFYGTRKTTGAESPLAGCGRLDFGGDEGIVAVELGAAIPDESDAAHQDQQRYEHEHGVDVAGGTAASGSNHGSGGLRHRQNLRRTTAFAVNRITIEKPHADRAGPIGGRLLETIIGRRTEPCHRPEYHRWTASCDPTRHWYPPR